jgi:hypothetical protein
LVLDWRDDEMTRISKINNKGLTTEKKALLKSVVGSASSPKIDLNKVRESFKYEKN